MRLPARLGRCSFLRALAALAGLLGFIGITCQFWAALNLNDIPLAKLCETYSGSTQVMTENDFNALADWLEYDIGCFATSGGTCMGRSSPAAQS